MSSEDEWFLYFLKEMKKEKKNQVGQGSAKEKFHLYSERRKIKGLSSTVTRAIMVSEEGEAFVRFINWLIELKILLKISNSFQ